MWTHLKRIYKSRKIYIVRHHVYVPLRHVDPSSAPAYPAVFLNYIKFFYASAPLAACTMFLLLLALWHFT
jgi:hypothetical protein